MASQIDYILLRQNEAVKVKNCKVMPGEECIMQHRLVCADLLVADMKKPKMKKGEKRIMTWKLKDDTNKKMR